MDKKIVGLSNVDVLLKTRLEVARELNQQIELVLSMYSLAEVNFPVHKKALEASIHDLNILSDMYASASEELEAVSELMENPPDPKGTA
jgi:hypothetical protein